LNVDYNEGNKSSCHQKKKCAGAFKKKGLMEDFSFF
jgi:hypothetical protein